MKNCSICKELKPLDSFPKCSSRGFRDGYAYVCKICHVARTKESYNNNPEVRTSRSVASRRWKENNREQWRENRRNQEARKRQTILGKLENAIHNGVYSQLKHGKKGRRAFSLLGYSPSDLKQHLESKFQSGMTWGNYGEWHIDHIIPRSAFHITSSDDIDFKRCWSLENLRPLWAEDNMRKHAKIESCSYLSSIDNT